MTDIITKRCTKCGEEFPATSEYFYRKNKHTHKLTARCKSCTCEVSRDYREIHPENPERKRERGRLYRAKVFDKRREYDRLYSKLHPEVGRRSSTRYAKKHPEKVRQRNNRYRANNRQRVRELSRASNKRYYLKHPELLSAKRHKRRALLRNAEGTHTAADIQAQLKRQKGRCYYAACGHCKLGDTYHVEHVVPLDRGGWNDPSNIVISCPSCNLHKHTKLPHEWPEGGRLL